MYCYKLAHMYVHHAHEFIGEFINRTHAHARKAASAYESLWKIPGGRACCPAQHGGKRQAQNEKRTARTHGGVGAQPDMRVITGE